MKVTTLNSSVSSPRRPLTLQLAILIMLLLSVPALSSLITITGKVVNEDSRPIAGATLTIVNAGVSITTQEDGSFNFDVSPIIQNQSIPQSYSDIDVQGNRIKFLLSAEKTTITMKLIDLRGRIVHSFEPVIQKKGSYSITPLNDVTGIANGRYILHVMLNGEKYAFSVLLSDNQQSISALTKTTSSFEPVRSRSFTRNTIATLPPDQFSQLTGETVTRGEVIDTIIVSKDGYISKHVWIDTYEGTLKNPIIITDNLRKMVNGAWYGSKVFDNNGTDFPITYGWFVCPQGRIRGYEKLDKYDFLVCGTWSMSGTKFTMNYYAIDVIIGDKWDNNPLYATYYYDYDVLYVWNGIIMRRLIGEIEESDCISSVCKDGSSWNAECSYDGDCGRCWYCDGGECRYAGEGPYGCYGGNVWDD